MRDTDNRVLIMRIASGPLSGNELMLKAGSHRIVIGPEQSYSTETDSDGFTTYCLPGEQGNYELAIVCDDDVISEQETESVDQWYLTLNGDCPDIKQPVIFQEVMLAEQFPVVIKMLNTPWNSEESVPLNVQTTDVENAVSDIRTSPSAERKFNSVYVAGIMLAVLATFIGWQVLNYNSEARQVKTLETLLQGSSSPLTVTTGENGQSLVLVKTQRDLDWSTQRLLREHYQEPVTLKKITSLEEEIETQLGKQIPGLLKVDLTLPCQPVIRWLKGDYPAPDNKQVLQTLTRFLGCPVKSQLESYSATELLRKAEQGLTESNVPWRVSNKSGTSIFIINASLNDKQALSAIDFSKHFTKRYGVRHIQFSISLSTNHLAGKSLVNNPNGYVLLDNNHWYFNPVSF
ncbi:PrgH/EprH family type III secretion apparatus protein [Yersinia aldovae]|uniref:Type III secretion system needle complex protein PrgH n=1 Tax=Yersinia aldovae TaxID=29483 RepID=A0ABP1YUN0_YERAL|nr:PrgH/EprH family type III secretion apparatus protein [Yersinia aldovae]CNL54969.1 type III secretion system needle complex protein PrgH [Yersinia aldovae]